ncbi:MAG: hypothetical protein HYV19_13710 [Gemmatimonadetes bacterium]|nr:hypothetical protein [Gemmatimonadota bacterium]
MVFTPSILSRRLAVGLLIASIACSERDPGLTSPRESFKTAAGSRRLNEKATLDGERDFVEVSNEVPSFGGYFLSDEGQLVVYVADTADFGKARNALGQRAAAGKFAHGARFQRPAVVVRKGTYIYRDLARWRDVVTQTVLGRVNGAISSDMDERRNTVTIGLLVGSEAAARPEIQKVLAANGIPVAAVHYISHPPIRKTSWPVTMLASSADTLIGGMRFRWRATPTTIGICTIGFPAAYNTGAVGFVTAAHCSHDQWETNDSSHARTSLSGQASAEPAIGVEYYDPLAGTCPFFWPCDRYRYSDASLYRVTGRLVKVVRVPPPFPPN